MALTTCCTLCGAGRACMYPDTSVRSGREWGEGGGGGEGERTI